MANYARRVSVYSSAGPDPVFDLTHSQLEALERIYGERLSGQASDELVSIAQNYIRWRIAELNSDNFSEVRRLFDLVKQAVSGFQKLTSGGLIPQTDAGCVLNGILDTYLREFPTGILERNLLILNPAESDWQRADAGGATLAIEQDTYVLMQIGISLGCAISKAEKDIAAQEADGSRQGFTPGGAFPEWLFHMRQWAMRHGFQRGPFTASGLPSRFSEFLFEVNKLFATHVSGDKTKLVGLKEPVASAEALAERLRKVNRAATRVRLEPMGVNAGPK
ncbi:hypothetical protein ACN2CC_33170 [Mesorhizobium muleiense]|uniref:hypothetical protein n=1 Tax=Mesorhizobium muleiense TaxID=1004279 RepID=UPI003AFA86BC